jgi:hypothetical protein
MLKPEEQEFVKYWEANRLQKKKVLHYLYAGLPSGRSIGDCHIC